MAQVLNRLVVGLGNSPLTVGINRLEVAYDGK
jgi:hypothetical protein